MKPLTPFGVLPVLYEETANGITLEFAEAQAIERYLARKFHYFGKNDYEHQKVEEYLTSLDGVFNNFSSKIVQNKENRTEACNKFYAEDLAGFIAVHEALLKKNGSNGHYVGDQTTLADLKAAVLIDRLYFLRPKDANEVPISAEKTPNLWKLHEHIHKHEPLAHWKKDDRHHKLSVATKGFFKFE